MNVTTKQFKEFSDIVYHECGINLHEGKQQLLQARLSKRLRSTGIASVGDYLDRIKENNQELLCFIDAISTNHTFFFREKHHFEYLNDFHQTIWCAASSSGEEAYSIAIHCLEKGFKPHIVATDISTDMLRTGQKGIYPIEKAKSIPTELLKKYFKKGHGKWHNFFKVRDELRGMVTFKRYNLVTDSPPSREYDLIFCRNVLIYFDMAVKTKVIHKLYDVLKYKGYLIIGGAESLNNIKHQFQYVRPSIYFKEY
jgi:chemotaxis protein methyltransferase CheR